MADFMSHDTQARGLNHLWWSGASLCVSWPLLKKRAHPISLPGLSPGHRLPGTKDETRLGATYRVQSWVLTCSTSGVLRFEQRVSCFKGCYTQDFVVLAFCSTDPIFWHEAVLLSLWVLIELRKCTQALPHACAWNTCWRASCFLQVLKMFSAFFQFG